ncbi:hypothetical protein CMI38_01525 [Candidatus Pacearchaeota archaeon]|nr:hypothetical protein [Candidatus Pacearchaeota archaeon]|tara:strand:- start:7640 stop:8938 length:1299 start_codon:yes stop_codon:yes gene_type:complete
MIATSHRVNNGSDNSDAKIALAIPTGRPRVGEVVNSFLENAEYFGYNLKQFSVYLSIDLEYQDKAPEDFKIDRSIEDRVNKVEYIYGDQRREFGEKVLERSGVDKDIADTLFIGRGYSRQRNVAILRAAEDGNDYAICFDDDEDPKIPVRMEDGSTTWTYPDFFTPHISALSNDVDITRGHCLGYLSPIPSDFERSIPEDVRRKLGAALSIGSEVLDADSFSGLMKKVRYLNESEISNLPISYIVKNGEYGKAILSGNMGINLTSLRGGKIPIFYTPPGARGEDAIFGLQLENLIVAEVSSYIFHDPFVKYPNISSGEVPNKLEDIQVDDETKKRFGNAVIGWIKYAPMLIAMTSQDRDEVDRRTGDMIAKIGEPTDRLAKLLHYDELSTSERVLRNYVSDLDSHMNELLNVQNNWRDKIAPSLEREVLREN